MAQWNGPKNTENSPRNIRGSTDIFFITVLSVVSATEAGSVTPSPGVYLRDDPVCGAQLENHSELRAPTAERAAYFLDAAIAARTVSGNSDPSLPPPVLSFFHTGPYILLCRKVQFSHTRYRSRCTSSQPAGD